MIALTVLGLAQPSWVESSLRVFNCRTIHVDGTHNPPLHVFMGDVRYISY